MSDRRSFLQKIGLLSLASVSGFSSSAWNKQLLVIEQEISKSRGNELTTDEDFWAYVQQCYAIAPGFINFNNGNISPAPKSVAEAMKQNYDFSNQAPSYFMLRILDKGRETLRKNLARLAGTDAEEIALVRNTSEALETVIFGINLQRGDEVVLTKQDYPNMIAAWQQREKREGIKLVWINLDLPSENDDALVKKYTDAFSSKTKVVQITHVINWTGRSCR
ncbi:MAG: aminotransferase class V-fold PLP-dependent enzyme [Ferruginibacter sp.]|nr:aminotransferase class V-fold PLP-dependent enzyme [Ferruginibacter sp.]